MHPKPDKSPKGAFEHFVIKDELIGAETQANPSFFQSFLAFPLID